MREKAFSREYLLTFLGDYKNIIFNSMRFMFASRFFPVLIHSEILKFDSVIRLSPQKSGPHTFSYGPGDSHLFRPAA